MPSAPTEAKIPKLRAVHTAGTSDCKAVVVSRVGDHHVIVKGTAPVWSTLNDHERFAEPGLFERALARYLGSNPVVLAEHDPGRALGTVDAAWRDEKGLHVVARIMKPVGNSPNGRLYQRIRDGHGGLSLGGRFKKTLTALGQRIQDLDIMAFSVVPSGAGAEAALAVTGGKAIDGLDDESPEDRARRQSAEFADARLRMFTERRRL